MSRETDESKARKMTGNVVDKDKSKAVARRVKTCR